MKHVLFITIAIIVVGLLVNQCRRPRGLVGRFLLWDMNRRHSSMTDWGLTHVSIEKHFTVLDVGCGGGRTVHKLAAIASQGKVCGIDYAAASVSSSSTRNKSEIEAGSVEIRRGSVSKLPYPDSTFDVVTAVETHYYWSDLAADLREVLRVLKPGGRLLIVAEAYKGMRFDLVYRISMKLLRGAFLGPREYRELFSTAGYLAIQVIEEPRKGWIAAIGTRPS